MPKNTIAKVSFGTIVAIIGSILIALGFAWLIAQNWHQIPAAIKILILVGATAASFFVGSIFRVRDYHGLGSALIVLGSLLYTLSIFLIAQIFSTETTLQGVSYLLLLAWAGVFVLSYIFNSPISLTIAFIEFLIWLSVQFVAFSLNFREFIFPGILAFYFLFTGILFYGLSLWHRMKSHPFARLYKFWTAFYFLAFTYILSFQVLLPILWSDEATITTAPLLLLLVLTVTSLVVSVSGGIVASQKKSLDNKEAVGVFVIVVILSLLIALTSIIPSDGDFFRFFSNADVPLSLWFVWIVINVAFIGIILAVIGYGTLLRNTQLINLGIIFFALDVITRYLGFIFNFWGFTSLAILFITGGLILIGGGYGIEKWRRNLVSKAKQTKSKG